MYQLFTVAVIVALFEGSYSQGVCQNSIYQTEVACKAIGCYWNNGNCNQPQECTAPNNDIITYNGMNTGVRVMRHPLEPETVRLCNQDTECSAMYRLTMMPKFVTGPPNCNDWAALPPHGVNQTECEGVSTVFTGLVDYQNHPFPNDGVKQSLAKSQLSVTSLTESGTNCSTTQYPDRNPQCAFPLGFKTDVILKDLGICVEVKEVADKWVEIMASSREGSNGGSYCVRDRNAKINSESGCTPSGDLIDIRESGNSPGSDDMNIIFYAQDNNDDAAIEILWRVSASYMPTTDTDGNGPAPEKDAEDWSLYRNGGEFPMSLMSPYPENYEGDPVFNASTSGSASYMAPSGFLVFVVTVIAVLFA